MNKTFRKQQFANSISNLVLHVNIEPLFFNEYIMLLWMDYILTHIILYLIQSIQKK